MSATRSRGWTLAIVSVGLFMVVLDNLVVSVALPSIHRDLGASIQSLEWTVNAYTLSYAVLLLTGAALGDRFGRKRMFMAGIALFTVSSAAAALAPSIGLLIVARATQGAGAAIATPLTLTLLADAYPPDRRGFAIGVWSGISGIAVALGPLVGGAMVQAASWHWIFWLNVPIGAALVPLAWRRLSESFGPVGRSGPAGAGAGLSRPVRAGLRPHPQPVARLDQHRGAGVPGRRRGPDRRLRHPGAPDQDADAADGVLRAARLRGHQRGVAVDVLRDVRLDLLPEPVPPERARQQPAARPASSCWCGPGRR